MRQTILSLLLGPFLYQSPTWGQAPQVKSQTPGFYRFMVGDIEVTALNDGVISCRTAELPGEQALADRFYRELIAIAAPGSARPGLKEALR